MNKINIDGLLALNLEEIKIIFLRCRGDTVEETAEYLHIGASTIYSRMPEICKLLGVKNWKEIEDELCISLRRIVRDVRALEEGWPEAFREKIEALREPKEPADKPIKPGVSPSMDLPVSESIEPPSNNEKNGEVSARPQMPWPLIAIPLVILGLLCIAGLVFGGSLLQNIMNPGGSSQPDTQTAVSSVQDTATSEPSPTVQPTNTETPLPTDTLTPTRTFTPTATLTPIPTDTVPPIGLTKGAVLQDDRVILKLTDVVFNIGYDRIGNRRAPVAFIFDFTNKSHETIVVQFDSSNFVVQDNTGRTFECWFFHISGAVDKWTSNLDDNKTLKIETRCGDGNVPPEVTMYTLTVHPFTSLPESTWVANVPR